MPAGDSSSMSACFGVGLEGDLASRWKGCQCFSVSSVRRQDLRVEGSVLLVGLRSLYSIPLQRTVVSRWTSALRIAPESP